MFLDKIPFKNIININNNKKLSNIYDIEIKNDEKIKKFSSLECHVVIYPYSRKICSKDIIFSPYEEYVKDIQSGQRSAYQKIISQFGKLFGLLIGLLISILFYIFNPKDLFSVESIVAIFGAYFICKELWEDFEKFFINITKKLFIRYQENYYSYQLEKNTTLTHYSYLAKKQRYKKETILPEKIDFIEQSNSQTIRLFIKIKNIKKSKEKSLHLMSMNIDKDLIKIFKNTGFMLGIKLSFNKNIFGINHSRELFQSINKYKKGCLDNKGNWHNNTLFYRKTVQIGRIKWFIKNGLIQNKSIINF